MCIARRELAPGCPLFPVPPVVLVPIVLVPVVVLAPHSGHRCLCRVSSLPADHRHESFIGLGQSGFVLFYPARIMRPSGHLLGGRVRIRNTAQGHGGLARLFPFAALCVRNHRSLAVAAQHRAQEIRAEPLPVPARPRNASAFQRLEKGSRPFPSLGKRSVRSVGSARSHHT